MAEAKAEVMEEIEDNREEGEEDDAMELTVVLLISVPSFFFCVIVCFQKQTEHFMGWIVRVHKIHVYKVM